MGRGGGAAGLGGTGGFPEGFEFLDIVHPHMLFAGGFGGGAAGRVGAPSAGLNGFCGGGEAGVRGASGVLAMT